MTETTNWSRLTEPFHAEDVEWRISRSGNTGNNGVWATCLAYITSRAIQNRLDEVFGVDGWKNEYRTGPDGGVVCRIYFRGSDGEWVWREDGAENTQVEAIKGGISGALKRAGSALGIGRYLYGLTENFAKTRTDKPPQNEKDDWNYASTKEKTKFYWKPPALPDWALPDGSTPRPEDKPKTPAPKSKPGQFALQVKAKFKQAKCTTAADAQLMLDWLNSEYVKEKETKVESVAAYQKDDSLASFVLVYLQRAVDDGVNYPDMLAKAGEWDRLKQADEAFGGEGV